MKVVVPTLNVRATVRETLTVNGKEFKPGAVITVAYGIALQGMARGVLGVIVDADNKHNEALQLLAQYGADSWFPKELQTIGMLTRAMAQAEQEAATAQKH